MRLSVPWMFALVLVVVSGCGASSAQESTRGSGEVTLEQGFAQVGYTLTGLGPRVSGRGVVDFTTLRSQTAARGLGRGDTAVVMDRGRALVRVDGITPPRRFVRFAANPTQDRLLGTAGPVLVLLQPIQLLQMLAGATNVASRGSARVSGTVTTVQRAVVDLDLAVVGVGRRALREALAAADVAALSVVVYLDDQDRVRRIESRLELGDGTVVDARHTFTRFGRPVEVDVPDPSSVVGTRGALVLDRSDISGQWVAEVVDRAADPPGAETLLDPVPTGTSFGVVCNESGRCGSRQRWTDRGGGSYVFRTQSTVACPTPAGTVAASDQVVVIATHRFRVVAVDGRRAIEMIDVVTESQRNRGTPGALVCLLADGASEATVTTTVRAERP